MGYHTHLWSPVCIGCERDRHSNPEGQYKNMLSKVRGVFVERSYSNCGKCTYSAGTNVAEQCGRCAHSSFKRFARNAGIRLCALRPMPASRRSHRDWSFQYSFQFMSAVCEDHTDMCPAASQRSFRNPFARVMDCTSAQRWQGLCRFSSGHW